MFWKSNHEKLNDERDPLWCDFVTSWDPVGVIKPNTYFAALFWHWVKATSAGQWTEKLGNWSEIEIGKKISSYTDGWK